MNTKNRGFTFVEVLIAVLIMGIVGGAAMQLFGLSQMFVDRQISSAMRLNAERFTLDSIYAELHKGAIASIDILSDDDPDAAAAVSDYKYIFLNDDGYVVLREWSASVNTHVDRQLLGADGVQRLMFSLSNDTQTAAAAHYMLLANVIARGVTRPEEGLERTIGRRIGLGRPVKNFSYPATNNPTTHTYTGTAVRFAFFVAPDTALTVPDNVILAALDPTALPGDVDNNDGKTWPTATRSVQRAIELASAAYLASGATPNDRRVHEVWVRAGAYSGSALGSPDTLTLRKGVNLYGGFSGDVFTSDDRTHTTILSGDNTHRVISCDGPSNAASADYRPTSADTRIDGFTITGGKTLLGGGMNNYYASPLITNCIFSGNTATNSNDTLHDGGGGMRNEFSSPTVMNCTFFGNTAPDGQGGGMFNVDSSPTVTNCTFSGNTARAGAGIHIRAQNTNVGDVNVTVTNCTFSGNKATYGDTGSGGGGMFIIFSNLTVTNCTFSDNTADKFGGAISVRNSSNVTITNTIFWGNTAPDEYEIHNFYPPPEDYYHQFRAATSLTKCVVKPLVSESISPSVTSTEPPITVDPLIVSLDRFGAQATRSIDVYIYKFKAGSSAIDRGISPYANVLSSDQRGVPRYNAGVTPRSSDVDIGAYEFNPNSGDSYISP